MSEYTRYKNDFRQPHGDGDDGTCTDAASTDSENEKNEKDSENEKNKKDIEIGYPQPQKQSAVVLEQQQHYPNLGYTTTATDNSATPESK